MPAPKDPIKKKEWKNKIRIFQKNRIKTKKEKKKISKTIELLWQDSKYQKKQQEANKHRKGHKQNKKTRKKIKKNNARYWKGKIKMKEHIQKISITLTGRKLSKTHIENIRKAVTGTKQSKEHIRKRVETRKKNNTYICTDNTKLKMRKARAKQKFPFSNTSIEIKLQNALNELKIIYQTQKYELIGIPDIFIEPNICIFADGDYWHNRPGAQERDECVNKKLKEQGYKVLRFWEHEIHTNIDICVNKIINKINEY